MFRHVMVCWVEADLFCAEGQETQGGLDRLKACMVVQSGRRPKEQSRKVVGSYIHVVIYMVVRGTLGDLTKLWFIV